MIQDQLGKKLQGIGEEVGMRLVALLLLSLGRLSIAAPDSMPVHLSSAETEVVLQAGREQPSLAALALKGGTSWQNKRSESLIGYVEINGETQPLHWRFSPAASRTSSTGVIFVYDSGTPHLRLSWEWRVRAAHGPLEHSIKIDNLSGNKIWIPLEDSIGFEWRIPRDVNLEQFWVEKGAGQPSDEGTHRVNVTQGYQWAGESSTYAHPRAGQQREIIPWMLVESQGGAEFGWYLGVEFSGRTRISLERVGDSLRVGAGLNPIPSPYRTKLAPGESFETPPVFLGTSRGGPDGAGNVLRRWVRDALNNQEAIQRPTYPLLVNNSWGAGMQIDETVARHMIRDSAELGFEMFHVDAGWFRGVGDWYPDPTKFPHGLRPIADYAHQLGLKFGLWMDWTQAAFDTRPGALNVNDSKVRGWLISDPPAGWKPEEFKGLTVDIGVGAAHDWAARAVNRVVDDYRLDMLEHDGYLVAQGCDRADHPHAPANPGNLRRYQDMGFIWVESSNSTDVSYHATQAYYDIQSRLRKQHPGLLLEVCNDGGRMVDFGSAAHCDYFSITDAYDPLSNRRAFYDASFVLPPAMLESYVERRPSPRIENFLYMLRSGMMGWFTLMLDTTTLTSPQRTATRESLALYKSKLRPLIREADLYHVSPRPNGKIWDGIEYFDPARGHGVLFAFHGSDPGEKNHWFALRGLTSGHSYQLTFEGGSSDGQKVSGKDLMQKGVQVYLPLPNSSELVFFEELD
ncbi:MAG: alpha-galactosidase [Acidobacteriaceae bacterium]|nr:alpha-galactosidase [Acidobacteriaceae bacterium]